MEWLQIITLALLQGLTEFLPVSSSAHLILPALLTDWPDQGLAFDIAVHVGTLAAVLVYYRQDLAAYASSGWSLVRGRGLGASAAAETDELLKLMAATVPIVVAGFLLKDWVEADLRGIPVIAVSTIVFALLLGYADRRHGPRDLVTWRDALVIGAMQTLALIPGTSRSGITITAALLVGMSRTSAARFSFLLAIPTIAGAALLGGKDLLDGRETLPLWTFAAGALLSGTAAYLCIGAFMRLVERTGMLPYVIYRLLLGSVLLVIAYGGFAG